ncbi:hypothetical protein BH11PLA2_BH11PLA2_01070 [soil metagenome]
MRNLFAVLMLAMFVPVVSAEDKVIDNPAFATWAKQKVGTTMVMKTISETGGMKSEIAMTYKVVEVKADKVIVEVATKSTFNGMSFDAPAQKMDIEKTFKVPAADPNAPKPEKPQFTTTTGEETLKIGGKDIKTKWTKVKGKSGDAEYESQTWTSDDMPNMTVKMVSKNTGKDASMTTTTTMEVTEFKVP